MPQVIEGNLVDGGGRYAIIVGRFNGLVTARLLEGALDTLHRHGIADDRITVVWCPGAFEIPMVARKLVGTDMYAAVICLGAVIRGSTPHFDYVAGEASKGIAQVGMESGVPVIFGVLTTDTIEQAIERAGTKHGNKGSDAALTAIEMVSLLQQI